jgi:dCMP deaminase
MNQFKLDKLYMDIAMRVGKESAAKRKQVGAVIVKDNNIVSFGWNGTPSGFDNNCECPETGETIPEVLHAEENALGKLLESGSPTSLKGATIYLTFSPCFRCAKMIARSGIKRVMYNREHSDQDPITFLNKQDIECIYVSPVMEI